MSERGLTSRNVEGSIQNRIFYSYFNHGFNGGS